MRIDLEGNKGFISFKKTDKIEMLLMNKDENFKKLMRNFDITNLTIDFDNRKDIDPFIIGILIFVQQVQIQKAGTLSLINFLQTNISNRVEELNLDFTIES